MKSVFLIVLIALVWFTLSAAPLLAQSAFYLGQDAPMSDLLRIPSDAKIGSEAQHATPEQIARLIDTLGVGSGLYGGCTPAMSAGDLAAAELVKIGQPAVESLIRVLQQVPPPGPDRSAAECRRAFAVQILGRIQDRRAVPAVAACLEKDTSSFVRVFAPIALESMGDPSAENSLLLALKDPSPDIQAGAAHALGTLHSALAIPVLVAMLDAPAARPAFFGGGWGGPNLFSPAPVAAWALGHIGTPAVPSLRKALSSAEPQSRRYAAIGLTYNTSPRVNTDVRALLCDTDPEVRKSAARSETLRHDILAVPLLAQLLHDPVAEVRNASAYALEGSQGLPELKALIVAANGPDPIAAGAAAEGLRGIWAPGAADLLLEEVTHGKGRARLGAAESLLHYNDPRAAMPILNLLEEPDPELRTTAVWIVNGVHDPRTFPALIRATSDPSEKVRIAATEEISQRKSDPIVAPLIAKLQDSSEQVRLYAIYGLGFKGDNEAVAPLQALLPAASPRVQQDVDKALEIIAGKRNGWY